MEINLRDLKEGDELREVFSISIGKHEAICKFIEAVWDATGTFKAFFEELAKPLGHVEREEETIYVLLTAGRFLQCLLCEGDGMSSVEGDEAVQTIHGILANTIGRS